MPLLALLCIESGTMTFLHHLGPFYVLSRVCCHFSQCAFKLEALRALMHLYQKISMNISAGLLHSMQAFYIVEAHL